MRNKKLTLFFTVCSLIFFCCNFPASVTALAANIGNTFSFRFENCTVADALIEISRKSGINIISNSVIKKEILSKSYVNRSLDNIIVDLLRGENCAVVWNYNKGNLESIGLYTFEKGEMKRNISGSIAFKRPVLDNTADRYQKGTDTSNIKRTRNDYLNNINNNRNVPNNALTNTGSSVNKSSSRMVNKRWNSGPGTSSASVNNQRIISNRSDTSLDNRSNNRPDTGRDNSRLDNSDNRSGGSSEDDENKDVQPSPESPEPEKYNGLEPPPMPPGF